MNNNNILYDQKNKKRLGMGSTKQPIFDLPKWPV